MNIIPYNYSKINIFKRGYMLILILDNIKIIIPTNVIINRYIHIDGNQHIHLTNKGVEIFYNKLYNLKKDNLEAYNLFSLYHKLDSTENMLILPPAIV